MSSIWDEFKSKGVPAELVDKLETAYVELKENFYLGKHKPSELEGGHLAELVVRILQWATGGVGSERYTPLGKQLPRFDLEVKRLEGLAGTYSKSLRVHIPRMLLAMYDIRNGRGVGHPGHDVDPNLADATYVATAADWVIAELMRIYHGLNLNEAQAVVDGLVQRRAPLVQMFGDFPKVLRTDLGNPLKALVLLYGRGGLGASSEEMSKWLRVETKEARRMMRRHDAATFVHYDDATDQGAITHTGIAEVERRIPVLTFI
jgi:hypothetical protein